PAIPHSPGTPPERLATRQSPEEKPFPFVFFRQPPLSRPARWPDTASLRRTAVWPAAARALPVNHRRKYRNAAGRHEPAAFRSLAADRPTTKIIGNSGAR